MLKNYYFDEKNEEVIEDFPVKNHSRRKRRKNSALKKIHYKKIAEIGNYPSGYYFSDGRLKKSSRGDNSKYLKNRSNRKIRRKPINYDINNSARGGYKKEFDYWWELI